MDSRSRLGVLLQASYALICLSGLCSCAQVSHFAGSNASSVMSLGTGAFFEGLMVVRQAVIPTNVVDAPLVIFIEGDGVAWSTSTQAAFDPTPRRTPMLDLMRASGLDAAYLGRPCYWINTFVAPCAPAYWTSHRFADEVVSTMTHAVRKLRGDADRPLVLVGHSGGGTLAVLIAARLSGKVGVVTFGAVLDHEAWTARHGASPLSGSLNPAQLAGDVSNFYELHVFATRDATVRVEDNQRYLNSRGGRPYTIIEGDHVCCWAEWWQTQGVTALNDLRNKREYFRGKQ